MEKSLHDAAYLISLVIEAAAVVIVTCGAIHAFVRLLGLAVTPSMVHGARRSIWQQFGTWLLLGLQFELAADIISSVVSPTWTDIGQLGAIAVIRTFLNYFLEQDLERATDAGHA